LQKLDDGPLTSHMPDADIWLDGGHNPLAGEVLKQHFASLPDGTLHLVIAMLSNKDPAAIIRPLLPKLASVTALPITGHDSHDAQRFADYLAKTSIDFDSAETIDTALKKLSDKRPQTVLVSGSLYLAGEVLAANGQMPS
jgi:dihydrofolate synthase/folylpolyglutamate synthase